MSLTLTEPSTSQGVGPRTPAARRPEALKVGHAATGPVALVQGDQQGGSAIPPPWSVCGSRARPYVDTRLLEVNVRWIASGDTPDGPTLGLSERAIDAIESALAPFEGIVEELMASLPSGLG